MRVAVRGDAAVARTVSDAAVSVVDDAAGADAVVAVGERALRSAVLSADAPILAVDAPGPYAVASEDVAGALTSLDDAVSVPAPVLTLTADGETRGRAVFDASLMTSEPAKISEYAVHADGRVVGRFRADGVVVATPLGSRGYARAAGGAVVGPGAGLSVVPVSPFSTRSDAWVLRPGLEVIVERDESPVSLFADENEVGRVVAGESITISTTGSAALFDVSTSR